MAQRHRRWVGAMMLGIASMTSILASQEPIPVPSGLPALALENLPGPARIRFERAHGHARAHPTDASAVGALGMMLHAHGQYSSAETCYRMAAAIAPDALAWAYLAGVAQSERADYDAALRSLRAALLIDPAYLPARVRLADTLMSADDPGGSAREYARLVRDFPELALAHYGLGRLSGMRGNPKEAVLHYRRAVDLAPQFGIAHYALALAYRDAALGDFAEQHLEAFRRWGAHRPIPPDPLLEDVMAFKMTARDLLAAAARLGRNGQLEESIALHLKAVAADPTAAQAHVNLISLYGRLGQPDRAEHHYRAAVALQNSLSDAHYNYGVLLVSTRRELEAAKAFREALVVNPFHARAHHNLGTLLAGQGRLDEAASHYSQAIANEPAHRGARFSLGRTLVALGRPREGAEQLERLLFPEDSETPRYLYALANAWFAAREIDKAREYGGDALRRARTLGQVELAHTIERALQEMAVPR